jgi:hypothetical protein
MSKIIGLISAWGDEDWINLAIEQALYACDDVVVNVGPYASNMIKFEDSTLEKCKAWGNKIRLITSKSTGRHDTSKANTLNEMMVSSPYFSIGSWIWLFDVDEYYLKHEIDEIKNTVMDSDYNWVLTNEKYFFINMQNHLIDKRNRLLKIEDTAHRFIPTQKWPGPKSKMYTHKGHGLFHYSTLTDPAKKIEIYRTERSENPIDNDLVRWYKDIYMKFDLNEEEVWTKKQETLFGGKGPYWNGAFIADENGKLFKYYGKHPEIIERAGLPQVEDFREYYKK